jgi:hypothetical protein
MKYVSINGHTIRANARTGDHDPPIRIAKSHSDKKPVYASEIEIIGPAKLIYGGGRILACGARLVLECENVKVLR